MIAEEIIYSRLCILILITPVDVFLLGELLVTWIFCAGSKDHINVQGEILEGLVARIVSPESSKHMEEVLKDFPPPPNEGGTQSCSLDMLLYKVAVMFVPIISKCCLFQLLLKST